MSEFYKKRKQLIEKEKNKWTEIYKDKPTWKYMRFNTWDSAENIAMDQFDLGWISSVNNSHPAEYIFTALSAEPQGHISYSKPNLKGLKATNIGYDLKWKLHHQAGKPYWTTEFMGFDSEDKTEHMKKHIGEQWKYYNLPIEYRLNKQGFRCNTDFDDVDWKNSYVITGCSHTFGIGQYMNETMGEYLSVKLNAPVINLSVAGTGNDTIMHNFVHLCRKYGKPKGIFVLWTYPYRFAKTLGYQREGYDAHGSYFDSVWLRFDILPGQHTPENYRDNINTDEKQEHLQVHQHDFLPNPEMYYRRTLAQETLIAIMGEENVFEQRADFPGWMWTEDIPPEPWSNSKLYSIRASECVPDAYKDIILNYFENNFKKWIDYSNPDGTLSKEQLYVINHVKARDIVSYTDENGPQGGHWGELINKLYVKKWLELHAEKN